MVFVMCYVPIGFTFENQMLETHQKSKSCIHMIYTVHELSILVYLLQGE